MRRIVLFLGLGLTAVACSSDRTPTAPRTPPASHGGSPEFAFTRTFKAVNPCTDEIGTWSISGRAVATSGSAKEMVGSGNVSTNDGFEGAFAGRWVIANAPQLLVIDSAQVADRSRRTILFRLSLYYATGSEHQSVTLEGFEPLSCTRAVPPEIGGRMSGER
jgi:hypothetical protein